MSAIIILHKINGDIGYLRTCSDPEVLGASGSLGTCRRRSLAKRFPNTDAAEDWVQSLYSKSDYMRHQKVSFARVALA